MHLFPIKFLIFSLLPWLCTQQTDATKILDKGPHKGWSDVSILAMLRNTSDLKVTQLPHWHHCGASTEASTYIAARLQHSKMKQLSNFGNFVVWFVSFALFLQQESKTCIFENTLKQYQHPSLLTKKNHSCHLFVNIANKIAISGPMNVATNFTRNVWARLAKKLPKLVNLSQWRWTIAPRWVGESWRCFCCQRIWSTSNGFQLLRSGCCLKVDPLQIWWRFSTNRKKKTCWEKPWKSGGNHVSSCIWCYLFQTNNFLIFKTPSCHSEVQLQRVSQEFLPPEKQERAANKKKHVQNNANQQKSKLALQNNIVTSHDAHDSFWMTEATSESFARFTGRK